MITEPVVLIVEDQPVHRLMVEKVLSSQGLRVVEAHDGREGLDYIFGRGHFADREEYPAPDLVLLDLKMPVLDGYDTLAALRASETTRELSVILVTTPAQEREIERAYRVGANGYLIKPVSSESLAETMKSLELRWLEGDQRPD